MSDIKTMTPTTTALDYDAIALRYLNVWGIEDEQELRAAVAEIWAPDGVEFVQGLRFEGHAQLTGRVARAYDSFFANERFIGGYDEDLTVHQDILQFTITMCEPVEGKPGELGEVAWAARVFLLLDEQGAVLQSYQVAVKALPA
jgi:hypothetical protein